VSSINISWRSANLSDQNANVGHGLCIYFESTRRRGNLAAFVEGFAWYQGGNKAIIRFDLQFVPSEKQQFAAFKAALEGRIRARDVSSAELVPGYRCIANA
jgi:hypothetical protein